jgi:hypothetical protein
MVIHTYNPSYLGDKDLEKCCSKPIKAKSYQDLILVIKLGVVAGWCYEGGHR